MRSIQTNPMIFMSDRLSVAFSFSRRGALTHHLQSRRWYPSRWSGSCALHELSFRQFSRGGRQCRKRTFPVQSALYLLYQQNDEVAYCHPISPPACENLPLAAFTQLWVSHSRRHPFSIFERETERKDGKNKWRFITWRLRWSAVVQEEALLQLPLI